MACLAREKVFGYFATAKQGVLIVNEEDTPRLIKERSLMLTPIVDDLPFFCMSSRVSN